METLSDVDESILDAAMNEFADNGFHGTVVSDIADRAGVGKGTIYRHFGKKSHLFGALIDRATESLSESIREVYDRTSDPEKQVRGMYQAHIEMFDEARPLVALIVNEGLDQTGDMRSDVVSTWEDYEQLVSEAFRSGVKKRVFRQSNPEKLTRLFLSWIWGTLRSSIIFSESNPGTRFGELLIDMYMEGLTVEG